MSASLSSSSSSAGSWSAPTIWLTTGDYLLKRHLGRGANGIVWEAQDLANGRLVAIKMPVRRAESFIDEARMQNAMAVRSSAVMPVTEARTYDGTTVLITDVAIGVLDTFAGQLDEEAFLGLLNDVGDALVAAHDAGFCHGDVKPEQILINAAQPGDRTRFSLADWGGASRTRITEVRGSPAFMCPHSFEALRRFEEDVEFWHRHSTKKERFDVSQGIWMDGHAADVYSFALTLLVALCGHAFMPYKSNKDIDTFHEVLQEDLEWFLGRFSRLSAEARRFFAWILSPAGQRPSIRQCLRMAKSVPLWLTY